MSIRRGLITACVCWFVGALGVALAATEDETRAIVRDMIADAEERSSLMAGAVAGHDGKFFLASDDGAFRLNVGGQIQFRYNLNFRNPDEVVNNDDFESGFNQPRIRLAFDGHIHSPRLFYKVMGDFGGTGGGGDWRLQDVWLGYNFENGLTLRGGQGITAFMREWYMLDQKMLTPERSLQSLVFGQFRSKFIDLKFQNDDVRLIGTFSDGFRSANTEFNADPADWALTGRAEWKWAGEWKQLVDEYRSPRGSAYAGVLGGAIHYEEGPNRAPGPPGTEEQGLFAWTVDLLTKGDGWNVMLAGVGYSVQDEAGVSGADFHDCGALVQGGVHVTDDIEIVGRYDVILPDDDRAADSAYNTVTGGFNWYLYGQAAKFQLAVIWFLDDTTDTRAGNFGNTGARPPTSPIFGSLPSAESGQVAVMMQWQLLF